MTKWPIQKLAQGTTHKLLQHHDATDIKKTYIFVFFGDQCMIVEPKEPLSDAGPLIT